MRFGKVFDKIKKMTDTGVHFSVTQPLFEFAMTRVFVNVGRKTDAQAIPTVLVLRSRGMTEHTARNIETLNLPDPWLNASGKHQTKRKSAKTLQ